MSVKRSQPGQYKYIIIFRKIFKEAGFQNIKITANDNSQKLIKEWNPNKSKNAVDYVVSAYIEALKQE